MNINPKPDANFRARSCLAQSVACKPRKLKVRGSIPGQSINPFCRCPHFLRESDRASRLSGFSGALAKKMKTSTKGIYGLTGDRTEYFQLRSWHATHYARQELDTWIRSRFCIYSHQRLLCHERRPTAIFSYGESLLQLVPETWFRRN